MLRVKSDNFGHKVKSDSDLVLSYFNYWNKNLIYKANSENPDETAHKEPSHLDFHCLQMYV